MHNLPRLILGLSACTMMPKYERPESPVSARFPRGSARSANIDDIQWPSFFTDLRLKRLIEIALENNRDLRVAALNVEKSQAQYRIQRASLLPFLDATGVFTRSRVAGDTSGGSGPGNSAIGAVGNGSTANQFNLSVGVVSYELDLFGRIRSGNQRSLQQYFAQVEGRRSTQISLVAQVAVQWACDNITS